MGENSDGNGGKRVLWILLMILIHLLILSLIIFSFLFDWRAGLLGLIAILFIILFHRIQDARAPKSDKKSKKDLGMERFDETLDFIIGTENLKSYRPQILVLTGNPAARPCLVDFAWNLTRGKSLLLCGYILQEPSTDRIFAKEERIDRHFKKWMQKRKIQGELVTVASRSVAEGTSIFMQTVGIGLLKPNILMMGFKTNWLKVASENMHVINDYFRTIEVGFSKHVSLVIFRNSHQGLDFSESMKKYKISEHDLDVESIARVSEDDKKWIDDLTFSQSDEEKEDRNSLKTSHQSRKFMSSLQNAMSKRKVHPNSDVEASKISTRTKTNPMKKVERSQSVEGRFKFSVQDSEQQQLLVSISKFHTKVCNGRVDVWWLNDNGGLALLLPHLLSSDGSYLEGASIRVFVESTETSTDLHKNNYSPIQGMMSKMRAFGLNSENLHVIDSFNQLPSIETKKRFNEKIDRFKWESSRSKPTGYTTQYELDSLSDKTAKILRLTELIHENSRDADLIVVTLPNTRAEEVSASVFLSWMDVLSERLPPMLLVKGNNAPVHSYFK